MQEMSRIARARTYSNSSGSSDYSIEWQVGGQALIGEDYDPECQAGSGESSAEIAKFLNNYGYGKMGDAPRSNSNKLRAEHKHGFNGGQIDGHNKSVYVLLYVTSLCLGVGWLLWQILPAPAEVMDFY